MKLLYQKGSFDNFGKRFCAYLIDMLLLEIVFLIAGFLTDSFISRYAFAGISYLLTIVYFAALESGEHQATIGKRILGLVVIHSKSGERISFKRAFARNVCRLINIPIYCLGYLTIMFTQKHQGLHDLIVHTQVVPTEDAVFDDAADDDEPAETEEDSEAKS